MGSGNEIAQAAKDYLHRHGDHAIAYGTGAGQLVCNQFVGAVLRDSVDPGFHEPLADDFMSTGHFVKTDTPANGDLVHWPGHIAVVTDASLGYFWGAQTSTGVAESNFEHGWWAGAYGGKKPDYFLRWTH